MINILCCFCKLGGWHVSSLLDSSKWWKETKQKLPIEILLQFDDKTSYTPVFKLCKIKHVQFYLNPSVKWRLFLWLFKTLCDKGRYIGYGHSCYKFVNNYFFGEKKSTLNWDKINIQDILALMAFCGSIF